MRWTLTAAALVLAACGSSASGGSPRRLSEKDDGRVVRVHRGATLQLQLHSTYWQVAAPGGGVLTVISRRTRGDAPGEHCVPGGGCGTVTVRLRADHAGRTVLRAGRTICGEAMRCVGHQGSYAVTVVVS